MFYKLSNQTQQHKIEEEMDAKYKYGHIYSPRVVIDGLTENTVSVITSDEPDSIEPSIWGILPESFSDDWQDFQNHMNTLNISHKTIDSDVWYAAPFLLRRCLILVTGYFTNVLVDDQLLPFYISSTTGKPFSIGGIYNKLKDGFLTTSVITVAANKQHQQIHNISNQMPLVIPKNLRNSWLDNTLTVPEIKHFFKTPLKNELRAIPVSKQIFDLGLFDTSINIDLVDDALPMPFTLQTLLADYNIKSMETD
ncbi:SOS response-associated peptidase family protein [Aurantibacter sp.]|uniref:SOS response-associated peptidase n=1 Tax=Aurantibacter sp. TaxID=2807103 RepID=UPI00326328D6